MERIIRSLIRNLAVHMREMEALGIAMEATTVIHMEEMDTSAMEGMDISTTEEMATTIMSTRITTTGTPREVLAITMEARTAKTQQRLRHEGHHQGGVFLMQAEGTLFKRLPREEEKRWEQAKSIPEGTCESCQRGGDL
jgi:hypothetical protein